MKSITKTLSRSALGAALALALLWALPSHAEDAVTAANVAQKITAAKTPADHEAIAAFYTSEAAAAGEKVKMHEQMDSAYKSGQVGKTEVRFHEHCKDLIASYKKEQKDNLALAKEHEAMAKAAAK